MKIYRAVLSENFKENKVYQGLTTRRAPSNVPYLIDNIWEFLRPEHFPSRRHAIYASPSIEFALQNASSGVTNSRYIGCELTFNLANLPLKIAHLQVADARYHADIKNLQKVVMNQLAINNEMLENKQEFSCLFLPCVSKEELTLQAQNNVRIKEVLDECKKQSTFWQDALNFPDMESPGELFFELLPAQSYQLTQIS
jgi:hypothetical protein